MELEPIEFQRPDGGGGWARLDGDGNCWARHGKNSDWARFTLNTPLLSDVEWYVVGLRMQFEAAFKKTLEARRALVKASEDANIAVTLGKVDPPTEHVGILT